MLLSRKELHNIPGWHTRRHLVVIESDDWGSVRMPSREVYERFIAKGIRVDRDPYCRYDNFATAEDLSALYDVLNSVRDKNGRPAVITANALSANPVFEKIKDSGFREYVYEPFTKTLERYPSHFGTLEVLRQGMAEGLIRPQSHGREHLYVKKWLKALQMGDSATMAAFDEGTFGFTYLVDPAIKQYYLGALNSGLDEDIKAFDGIITEGLDLFEDIFGYRSESFIATTYEWNPKIEPCLIRNGVKYIQGEFCQKIPLDDDTTVKYEKRGFQGSKTRNGLVRLFRNCFFEPSVNPSRDWVDACLERVAIAFKWGKAANICSHRVNFIGNIDPSNTARTLPEFKRLLHEIVKRWPDVEFVSSDQLGHIITGE